MVCIRPDGEPEGTLRVDEGSDSSEDERPPRNTVGEVPLQWYNGEEHIGYDHDAKKLIKRTRKDKLETLLAQTDTKQGLRTIYDEYNDEEIVLSKDELRMIQRIRQGQFPDVEVTVLHHVSVLPTCTQLLIQTSGWFSLWFPVPFVVLNAVASRVCVRLMMTTICPYHQSYL